MNRSSPAPSNRNGDAHSWRISLNLTRRIVRRMMELTEANLNQPPKTQPKISQVPAAHDFKASVRLLRRTIRRTIVHSEILAKAA